MKAKAATLCLTALLLSGCGFSPVYGTHDNDMATSEALNAVAIDNIPNRNGQMLRNDLIDRMYGKGRPAQPSYHLAVGLVGVQQDLGIQADATSTRALLDLTATYTLTDLKNTTLLSGTAHSVTSFNKLSDQYSSLVSSESAYERTIKEVSEQIVNRLSLYFAEPVQVLPDTMIKAPLPPPVNSQVLPTTSQMQQIH